MEGFASKRDALLFPGTNGFFFTIIFTYPHWIILCPVFFHVAIKISVPTISSAATVFPM